MCQSFKSYAMERLLTSNRYFMCQAFCSHTMSVINAVPAHSKNHQQSGGDSDCTLRSRSASGCCFAICRKRWLSPLFRGIHAEKKHTQRLHLDSSLIALQSRRSVKNGCQHKVMESLTTPQDAGLRFASASQRPDQKNSKSNAQVTTPFAQA